MSRLARLSLLTTVLTFLAVTAGGLVRATGSGLGCPGWPRCFGRWIPPANAHSIIEMSHRYLVSLSIWAAVAVCVSALVWHRRDRVTFGLGLAIVPLFAAQAALGAYVVHRKLTAWTVVAHLALAMVVVGLLILLTVHLVARGRALPLAADRRMVRLASAAALSAFGLMLLGSYVTGRGAGLAFTDWPLMHGRVIPDLSETTRVLQFSHRVVAALVGLFVGYVVIEARRRTGAIRRLGELAGALFVVEIIVGGLNVMTRLHSAVVTTHLALSSLIWGTLVTLIAVARRTPVPAALTVPEAGLVDARPASSVAERVVAYVALTKPRIVELLLITTVPTMVVAARGVPSGWLVLATLLGGSLAAGGANAINMYVDRDIDRLMKRTRHRPLVTGAVPPANALFFGITLNVLAFVELANLVNPLSAALAVSATLFYVFVYTLWLKRSSVSNIVIGGAAGAVPVLVGWAAVTGSLGLAPLVLFAIIFWWTPPHFWALAIRYRDDYAAADVPMLPVVGGFRKTARQIVVYTVLLWALTLLFYPVGRMGDLYLAAAVFLGGIFTYQAFALWRRVVDAPPDGMRDASGAAMRLFGYSISYLALLFAAMAVDQLIVHG